jgi:hypothetical protein
MPFKDKEKRAEYNKQYYNLNKDKMNQDNKIYRENNREEILEGKRLHYLRNREHHIEVKERWRKNNQKRVNSYKAKRRAAKLNQTPKWADLKAIEEFYKNCPNGMTVDHIIPLQGKNVRGLHVLENLQYLTKSENSRKRNKHG